MTYPIKNLYIIVIKPFHCFCGCVSWCKILHKLALLDRIQIKQIFFKYLYVSVRVKFTYSKSYFSFSGLSNGCPHHGLLFWIISFFFSDVFDAKSMTSWSSQVCMTTFFSLKNGFVIKYYIIKITWILFKPSFH
jgi:hypothetical protein